MNQETLGLQWLLAQIPLTKHMKWKIYQPFIMFLAILLAKTNISAGQKACDIFKPGKLGKT